MTKFAIDFFKENLRTSVFGRSIDYFQVLDSTNSFLLNKNSEFGSVVVAGSQASGKGKGDRVWHQFDEALTFSLNLPLLPNRFLLPINILAGYAMIDVLRSQHAPTAMLKWPNDILVHGKKLCGMMINAKFNGSILERIVLGIGMNISGDVPDNLKDVATTIARLSDRPFYPEVFLAQFLNKFEKMLEKLPLGAIDIKTMWKDYTAFKGKTIKLTTNGEEKKYQEFGIDYSGNLVVVDSLRKELLTITNGDIGYDFSS